MFYFLALLFRCAHAGPEVLPCVVQVLGGGGGGVSSLERAVVNRLRLHGDKYHRDEVVLFN